MNKLAAGNWKMNGMRADLDQLGQLPTPAGVEVLICPPATLLAEAAGRGVLVGGQDCHSATAGAHTGDLSAAMLADAGASHVILGHSERRSDHGEGNADVRAKVAAALTAGLVPIVCVGESAAQYEAGDTAAVVRAQVTGSLPDTIPDTLVVAYEPIWAIGTGLIPSLQQIADTHGVIREALRARYGDRGVRVLYGGSVKPGNAADIFAQPGVDGALVGGASLKAADFGPIITALAAS